MIKTFSHSGEYGDIIYSLPAIRAAGGGVLYLFHLPGRTAHGMSAHRAAQIRPLLLQQPYIVDVVYDPNAPDHDLNGFRDHHGNLADQHLCTMGMSWQERSRKWLQVDTVAHSPPVIFARSPRYHNNLFPWKVIRDQYWECAAFIGHRDEHETFCREYGDIEYVQCDDLLQVARVIAGCRLFIGNQSCPAAIAEGLKHTMILEVCRETSHSCMFHRLGCIYGWDERIELPAIEELLNMRPCHSL